MAFVHQSTRQFHPQFKANDPNLGPGTYYKNQLPATSPKKQSKLQICNPANLSNQSYSLNRKNKLLNYNTSHSSSAPFNSSTSKTTVHDKKHPANKDKTRFPGPGHYDISNNKSTSMAAKCDEYTAYHNPRSVLVKYNTTGSSGFKSQVERFKGNKTFKSSQKAKANMGLTPNLSNSMDQSTGPGPGQYSTGKNFEISSKIKGKEAYRQHKEAMQNRRNLQGRIHMFIGELKRQQKISYRPSIPSSTLKLIKTTQNVQGQEQIQLARNSQRKNFFENIPQKKSRVKSLSWGKQKRKMLGDMVNLQMSNIGPGTYDPRSCIYNQSDNVSIGNANTTLQIDHYPSYCSIKPPSNCIGIPQSQLSQQRQRMQQIIDLCYPHRMSRSKKNLSQQTSCFKSKSIRSFFDKICFETLNSDEANMRYAEAYKSNMPGPGEYQINGDGNSPDERGIRRNFNHLNNVKFQFFGSTVQRFPQSREVAEAENEKYLKLHNQQLSLIFANQFCNQNIVRQLQDIQRQPVTTKAPTTTSNLHSEIGKKKSFNKMQGHYFLSDQQRKTAMHVDDRLVQHTLPGPGDYESEKADKAFKPRMGKIIQNFGNSIQRFKSDKKENDSSRQRHRSLSNDFVDVNTFSAKVNKVEKLGQRYDRSKTQSYMFSSKSKKLQQPTADSDLSNQNFGKYDTSQFDISTQLKKQKLFQQNLNKIDVERAPFNSKGPRFRSTTQAAMGSKKLIQATTTSSPTAANNIQQPLTVVNDSKGLSLMNIKSQLSREKVIQQNNEQVINSRKGVIYPQSSVGLKVQDRFKPANVSHLQTPIVGKYNIRSNWQKKSYNVKYSSQLQIQQKDQQQRHKNSRALKNNGGAASSQAYNFHQKLKHTKTENIQKTKTKQQSPSAIVQQNKVQQSKN